MAVVVEGGLAVVAMGVAWMFGMPLREQFPQSGGQFGAAAARGVVAALPMLAMFWWLVRSRQPAWKNLREQVEQLVGELFPSGSWAQFALVALLAGVGEELLFRGVLQTLLVGWTTPFIGLAIGSVLFGLAHSLSRLYFALATMIGLFLGALAMHYQDLAAPMTAHAVYDFVALVYLGAKRNRR
jgi:membrane protease YdiL (CAAX protease family)